MEPGTKWRHFKLQGYTVQYKVSELFYFILFGYIPRLFKYYAYIQGHVVAQEQNQLIWQPLEIEPVTERICISTNYSY